MKVLDLFDKEKRWDPFFFLHFVNTELAKKPLKLGVWQKSVLEYLRTELMGLKAGEQRNIFIALAGGRGTGKTTLACFISLWLIILSPDRYAFCRMYANTEAQLRNALLATLKNMIMALNLEYFVRESGLLAVKSIEKAQNEISARVWSKTNYHAVRGEHGDLTIRVFDECSGIPDEVFQTVIYGETFGTNINILLGNPKTKSGFFYDIFHGNTTLNFFKKHISIFECEHIESDSDAIKQLCLDIKNIDASGDLYRVEILGQFPTASSYLFFGDEINILEVRENEFPMINTGILGVDIASGDGDDFTVIAHRIQGIIYIRFFGKITLPELKNKLYHMYYQSRIPICVDSVGIGTGLRQELLALNVPASPVIGNAASYNTRAADKRSELYLKLKEFFDSGGQIVCPMGTKAILKKELNEISGAFDENGRISILSKKKMKKSPDIVDALSYTFYQNLPIGRPLNRF